MIDLEYIATLLFCAGGGIVITFIVLGLPLGVFTTEKNKFTRKIFFAIIGGAMACFLVGFWITMYLFFTH